MHSNTNSKIHKNFHKKKLNERSLLVPIPLDTFRENNEHEVPYNVLVSQDCDLYGENELKDQSIIKCLLHHIFSRRELCLCSLWVFRDRYFGESVPYIK